MQYLLLCSFWSKFRDFLVNLAALEPPHVLVLTRLFTGAHTMKTDIRALFLASLVLMLLLVVSGVHPAPLLTATQKSLTTHSVDAPASHQSSHNVVNSANSAQTAIRGEQRVTEGTTREPRFESISSHSYVTFFKYCLDVFAVSDD